jgi:hypothetical protein
MIGKCSHRMPRHAFGSAKPILTSFMYSTNFQAIKPFEDLNLRMCELNTTWQNPASADISIDYLYRLYSVYTVWYRTAQNGGGIHRYLMSRLSLQVFYLWRHLSSTAPPLILWWWNLEILFGPLHRSSPFIGELRCQAIHTVLYSRENPKRSLYCEMSVGGIMVAAAEDKVDWG